MSTISFTSVQRILQGIAPGYGFEIRLWEYRLKERWAGIVGMSIAAHTRPDRIKFRKLYVIVENSVWLQQLMFLKPTLLEKINAAMEQPLINDMAFRIGEWAEGITKTMGTEEPQAPGSSEALIIATQYTASVKNPDLRRSLTRVIVKALTPKPTLTILGHRRGQSVPR